MMNRRGFLGSILAACAAPAIVRADSLMRIVAPDTLVLRPNSLLTIDQITREALQIFDRELQRASRVNAAFDSSELAISLDQFSSRALVPAVQAIALAPKRPWLHAA